MNMQLITPDQEEFKNLIVDPTEIRHQISGWESSKRLKGHDSCCKLPSICEKVVEQEDAVNNLVSVSENFVEKTILKSKDETAVANLTDIEIIEFFLGSSSLRDPSQPLPPPTRFSRKAKQ